MSRASSATEMTNALLMDIGEVDDHRVLSNRSKALVAIGNYSEALKDAERCCVLRPLWPKVRIK